MAKKTKKRATKGKKKPAASRATKTRQRPTNQPLVGMEDSAIQPLENTARRYAKVRDERIEVGRIEGGLKDKLLVLMKQHRKKSYRRDGIRIDLVTEKETVKVKVSTGDEDL